jgi:hypothetical protein
MENNSASYKYDLILFPKILEFCMTYLVQVKQEQYLDLREVCNKSAEEKVKLAHRYENFERVSQQFLKRLLYLLESSNLNVQIIINNVNKIAFLLLLYHCYSFRLTALVNLNFQVSYETFTRINPRLN